VFVVSGGAEQEIAQACGMVMASANVAIASMASSMASAGVKTWDAPAPTMTMALGGSNRDQEDFSQCVERGIDAAPPAPWGNGLPPKVIITTGPKGRDPRICQQGAGLLTSALYSWFGQVSMTRAPGRFDNRRPTMTFAGADCATRYSGNADNIPGFQIYKTRGPPRPTLNPLNPLNPPRLTRPPPLTITQRPYTYTQVPAPATITMPQPPPVIITPRPYTQVAAPATVTITPAPYTTVAPRPIVTITLPVGSPPPQGALQQNPFDAPRGSQPGWGAPQQQQGGRSPPSAANNYGFPRGAPRGPPQQQAPQQGGANWGPPRGAPRGVPNNGPAPYQGPQGPYQGQQSPYQGPQGPYQGQQGGYQGPAPWRGQN
jgi:hypothetical protein